MGVTLGEFVCNCREQLGRQPHSYWESHTTETPKLDALLEEFYAILTDLRGLSQSEAYVYLDAGKVEEEIAGLRARMLTQFEKSWSHVTGIATSRLYSIIRVGASYIDIDVIKRAYIIVWGRRDNTTDYRRELMDVLAPFNHIKSAI